MNYRLHNLDLGILQKEATTHRYSETPAWSGVDWKPTAAGGNLIYLRQVVLPPTASVRRTDIKIEAPPNLYDPLHDGRLAFYRNLWISPGIRLFDGRQRRWFSLPRLHTRDPDGFAYLCFHPDPVAPDSGMNILHFIRVFDLFLLNPAYKAEQWERARMSY